MAFSKLPTYALLLVVVAMAALEIPGKVSHLVKI